MIPFMSILRANTTSRVWRFAEPVRRYIPGVGTVAVVGLWHGVSLRIGSRVIALRLRYEEL